MSATNIEWTDVTWNPVRGCTRVSDGCRNCYAERQAARFSDPGQYSHGFVERTSRGPRWTGRVELAESKLLDPLSWRKPRRVFVNSMSDLFHEALPFEAIDRVLAVMALAQRHTFQVLTKRPERMREYFNGPMSADRYCAMLAWVSQVEPDAVMPDFGLRIEAEKLLIPNVWLGVSVEDQATADERIPVLLDTPAAVRFVSYEPALGPVDLRRIRVACGAWAIDCACSASRPCRYHPRLDWLIVGGESGPCARPCDVAWIRSAVDQCREAGVACFVKQLGARPLAFEPAMAAEQPADSIAVHGEYDPDPIEFSLVSSKGGDPSEWPEDLRVRQFPKATTSPQEAGNA